MEDIDLIKQAIEARKNCYTPYSNYNVGAAILTKSGKIYKGANVECSNIGLTICAERVALAKAVSEGDRELLKIAVVGGKNEELIYTTPCGTCRQFLAEFNYDMDVLMGYMENDEIKYKKMKIKELLPESFVL